MAFWSRLGHLRIGGGCPSSTDEASHDPTVALSAEATGRPSLTLGLSYRRAMLTTNQYVFPTEGSMSEKPPPVDGFEYPTKPDGDVSSTEMMEWMEQVDHYWTLRGLQKLDSDGTTDSE
jgi:hypothetical protein